MKQAGEMHPSKERRQPKWNGSRVFPPPYPRYLDCTSGYAHIRQHLTALKCGCTPLPQAELALGKTQWEYLLSLIFPAHWVSPGKKCRLVRIFSVQQVPWNGRIGGWGLKSKLQNSLFCGLDLPSEMVHRFSEAVVLHWARLLFSYMGKSH